MSNTIGIRREDKNKWEQRVPLAPNDMATLAQGGIRFLVQPSDIRVYSDDDYRAAGVRVEEDLEPADVVLAVKEIPIDLLRKDKVYVFFGHVIKGQPHNMPLLGRLLELGCTLVDYEKIADDKGRRLIFFSVHAGYAGMIETLWSLGRRLDVEGIKTPFRELRHAYEYDGLDQVKAHVRMLGERIGREGLPEEIQPLVFGVAGYGNVAKGCQEILANLPAQEVQVGDLPRAASRKGDVPIVKVTFKEEHMVRPKDSGASFELQDYYQHPERYVGCFEEHLPNLDLLANTIYWEERYPRLVTRDWVRRSFAGGQQPRLKVVGDMSCDLEGSIEPTLKTTEPDAPCFVYDPDTDAVRLGHEGRGLLVMAVDNLPCELPHASSDHFSMALRDMIPALADADWQSEFDELDLPPYLKNAVIAHRGELAPAYRYLEDALGEMRREK